MRHRTPEAPICGLCAVEDHSECQIVSEAHAEAYMSELTETDGGSSKTADLNKSAENSSFLR